MAKITYADKVALNENAEIADINKVNASDMNEIKNVVNEIDDSILNTITFSGEWMIAINADGAGWTIAIPCNNPQRKTPTLNLTDKKYYNDSWINIESVSIRHYTESAVFLYMTGITTPNNTTALISFHGTLSF